MQCLIQSPAGRTRVRLIGITVGGRLDGPGKLIWDRISLILFSDHIYSCIQLFHFGERSMWTVDLTLVIVDVSGEIEPSLGSVQISDGSFISRVGSRMSGPSVG